MKELPTMRCDYVGLGLLRIAAFLYAARYVTAALFMGPGLKNWDASLFRASYGYVGNGLTVAAIISAAAGTVMLVLAVVKKKDA